MANRNFNQFRLSLEASVVDLYVKVTYGSSGAPTLNKGKGIASVERLGTGHYRITLQDTYQRLLQMTNSFISVSAAPAAPDMNIIADNVNLQASKAVEIQFRDLTGTATDPASGEISLMQITLSNTSV